MTEIEKRDGRPGADRHRAGRLRHRADGERLPGEREREENRGECEERLLHQRIVCEIGM